MPPLCFFSSNVSSKRFHERMHNHIGCICLAFLQCGFSNDSSNCLPERRHSHTGRICFTPLCTMCFQMHPQITCPRRCIITLAAFVQLPNYVFSNAQSCSLSDMMYSHTDCICVTLHHCALSNVSSNYQLERMQSHNCCIGWLFSTVRLQMCP